MANILGVTRSCEGSKGSGVWGRVESKIQTTRKIVAADNTITNVGWFLITLVTFGVTASIIPRFFVDASSPVLLLKDDSLVETSFPSVFTFLVPDEVLLAFAIFGYGTGTGPLGGAGVLHTSGKDEIEPSELFLLELIFFTLSFSSSSLIVGPTNNPLIAKYFLLPYYDSLNFKLHVHAKQFVTSPTFHKHCKIKNRCNRKKDCLYV